ncbi:MAG: hypothetical protein RIR11_1221 [Bacteroidota bacterium]|jgi:hypothetical protein
MGNKETPLIFTTFKNKTQFAQTLGMSLSSLQRRLEKLQIEVPRGLISPTDQENIYQKMIRSELTRNDAN